MTLVFKFGYILLIIHLSLFQIILSCRKMSLDSDLEEKLLTSVNDNVIDLLNIYLQHLSRTCFRAV